MQRVNARAQGGERGAGARPVDDDLCTEAGEVVDREI